MPAIHTLQEVCSSSSGDTSSLLSRLCTLYAAKVGLVPTLIIPQETLLKIATHNDLITHLPSDLLNPNQDPLEQYRVSVQLRKLITEQQFPDTIHKELIAAYHSKLKKGYVEVRIDAAVPHEIDHANIHGDANVLESILHIWADAAIALYQTRTKQKNAYLAPGAIIVQSLPQATASGVISTRDIESSNSSQMAVYSTWGVSDSVHHTKLHHRLTIDIRTLQIIDREQVTQTTQLVRSAERFDQIGVPKDEQDKPSLTDPQVKEIAKQAFKIKKLLMHNITVSWQLVGKDIVFSDWNILDTAQQADHKKSQPYNKTVTKCYTISRSYSDQALSGASGVGLCTADDLVLHIGEHPRSLVTSKQKQKMIDAIKQHIRQHIDGSHPVPVWYRSLNLTSNELMKLKRGNDFEVAEPNPLLGYRGALRALHTPEVFAAELELLEDILASTSKTVGLILPFVRTPSELHGLVNKVVEARLTRFQNFELWMQLNTPENILNMSAYHLPHISGFLVNVGTVQACLYGIDPDNSDITGYYNQDYSLLERLLEQGLSTLSKVAQEKQKTHMPNMRLYCNQFTSSLIDTAVKLHFEGVVIHPHQLSIAHTRIEQLELETLNKTQ